MRTLKKQSQKKVQRTVPAKVLLSLELDSANRGSPNFYLSISRKPGQDSFPSKITAEQLTALLPHVQRRVRFVDPIVYECIRTGSCNLGDFPLIDGLSDMALIALCLAVLAEREYVALAQVCWPEHLRTDDFASLHLLSLDDEVGDALTGFVYPRYCPHFPAPFEFLPYHPRGLLARLLACRNPRAAPDSLGGRAEPKALLSYDWPLSDTGQFVAPVVARAALSIADQLMGQFARSVELSALRDEECSLTEVEVFPQVSPFGHAGLWLASLRDARLVRRDNKPKWPVILPDDVSYMATFGNAATQQLVEQYLQPLT